ncbi:hypothetical protein EV183_005077 [Coemansia sp. RSA 2336]|nr:hypothetical protein EV183_005077 [Coemansia sp. RSA 2336]
MADSEIEQLMRATRQGGSSQTSEKEREMEQVRQENLDRVLDKDARQRLGTIKMVKPEKARKVEDAILRMAQMGQIRSKITEEQLKGILDQFNETQSKQDVKIVYNRKGFEDSDDEEYDLALLWFSHLVQTQLRILGRKHNCIYELDDHVLVSDELTSQRHALQHMAKLVAAESKQWDDRTKADMWEMVFNACCRSDTVRLLQYFVPVLDECGWTQLGRHELVCSYSVPILTQLPIEQAQRLWSRLEMARAQLVLHLLQSQEQGIESKAKAFIDSIMASRELAQQMVEDIARLVLETRSERVVQELEDQTDCDVVELFGRARSEQPQLWPQWRLIVRAQGLPPAHALAVWLRIIAVAGNDFPFALLDRYFACKAGDSRLVKERAVALDVAAFVWSPLSAGTRARDGVLREWRRRVAGKEPGGPGTAERALGREERV